MSLIILVFHILLVENWVKYIYSQFYMPQSPPYCAADMNTRSIPSLTNIQLTQVSKLIQVQGSFNI